MSSLATPQPFALDPLMAEAKRRARQRRFLVAVIVLVLIGLAAAAVAAFRSPQGPTSLTPSTLTPSTVHGQTGEVTLVGSVLGTPQTASAYTRAGMRFQLKDIGSTNPAIIAVVYHGSVPDLFKAGLHVMLRGTLRDGIFVARAGSLVTKVSRGYVPVKPKKP
jgi:cytochrome c-type biogenesis protein CcmE